MHGFQEVLYLPGNQEKGMRCSIDPPILSIDLDLGAAMPILCVLIHARRAVPGKGQVHPTEEVAAGGVAP